MAAHATANFADLIDGAQPDDPASAITGGLELLPFFRAAGLNAQRCAALKRRVCAQGEYIYDQGSPATTVFVLLSGGVHVFRRYFGERRGERQQHDVVAGEAFGEVSLLAGTPHASAARATKRSVVVSVPGNVYLDFFAVTAAARVALALAPLHSMPRLREMDDSALAILAHLAHRATFAAGSSILVQGRAESSLVTRGDVAILLSGSVTLKVTVRKFPRQPTGHSQITQHHNEHTRTHTHAHTHAHRQTDTRARG